ncbi:DUF1542 domain-containing protein [Fructobacillus sp. M1-13]|uniref:DUF1542 domain-containing protein n=1 Tax=Fructobacillus papyriferae TaxID=2713171 RepID=A0ABS5QNT9_9LACO|nr:DUF1542 domain-containing protein [Fructobacillus papyriferae]MBS9334803.1 DUF1542 domain-containing protein [Fructobacillus papyriferae]MCD2158793.1 DUF1542 domain-containing protein [Fructobacillus papyriferae]
MVNKGINRYQTWRLPVIASAAFFSVFVQQLEAQVGHADNNRLDTKSDKQNVLLKGRLLTLDQTKNSSTVASEKSSNYEREASVLGGQSPLIRQGGNAQLSSDGNRINLAGKTAYSRPDYGFFGLEGKLNDYANVSLLRLNIQDNYSGNLQPDFQKAVGDDGKKTINDYHEATNTLSYAAAFPYALTIKNADSGGFFSGSYFVKFFENTLSALSSLFTTGNDQTDLYNEYNLGEYGAYIRLQTPDGVDPNDWVKTLNLNQTNFGSKTDINAVQALREMLNNSSSLRRSVARSLGANNRTNEYLAEELLQNVLVQINGHYGTKLVLDDTKNIALPLTLSAKDVKINTEKDPNGLYLMVRGAGATDSASPTDQARYALAKFILKAMSTGGTIPGGVLGYMNFNMSQYSGNLSTSEINQYYGGNSQTAKEQAVGADDSPNKILTKGQLPPAKNGRFELKSNVLDTGQLLSTHSKSYGNNGDIGDDLSIHADQIGANALNSASTATWRGYISLNDNQQTLNTKSIIGHPEEWEETPGSRRALNGTDLDHRSVSFSAGQTFWANKDRFDRVIDYFDHTVLLDAKGVHPTADVKDVKLVKSVDPDGKKTAQSDFEIYDRPFTVYYSGQMTLSDGSVIPLRKTQMTVFQSSGHADYSLIQKEEEAFESIERQADNVRHVLANLKPKLTDDALLDDYDKISAIVSAANENLSKATGQTAISSIEEDALNQLNQLLSEESKDKNKTDAMLLAAKELGKQAINQKALQAQNQLLAQGDSAAKQKASQVQKIQAKALSDLDQATDADAAQQVTKQALLQIDGLYLSDSQLQESLNQFNAAVAASKTQFEQTEHAKDGAIEAAVSALEKLKNDGDQALSDAKSNEDNAAILQHLLQEVNQVKKPEIDPAYRPVTAAKKKNAKESIQAAVLAKKKAFEKIDHVDAESLSQQEAILDQISQQANEQFDQEQYQGALADDVDQYLKKVQNVVQPTVQLPFQEPSQEDLTAAQNALTKVKDDRLAQFKAVQNVSSYSYDKQENILTKRFQVAYDQLGKQTTKGDLAASLKAGQAALQAIALPKVQAAYQPADPNDVADAKTILAKTEEAQITAFQSIDGVNSQSLSAQIEALKGVLKATEEKIDQATDRQSLNQLFRQGVMDLLNVQKPTVDEAEKAKTSEDENQAVASLKKAIDQKKQDFASILHVDQDSLSEQQQALIDIQSDAKTQFDQSQTKGDLSAQLSDALELVNEVATPVLQFDYQKASSEALNAAGQSLQKAGEARKQSLAIQDADQNSLEKQQGIVAKIIQDYQGKLTESLTNRDLQTLLQEANEKLAKVALPTIVYEKQAVDEATKKASDKRFDFFYQKQIQKMQAVDHVDVDSLKQQEAALAQVKKQYETARDQAQNKGELNEALNQATDAVLKISMPVQEEKYQAKTDSDVRLAEQTLAFAQGQREKDFAIENVDEDQLSQAKEQLTAIYQKIDQQLQQAQTKGEVSDLVQEGLADFQKVQAPTVKPGYEPVTSADQKSANDQLTKRYQDLLAQFKNVKHVDTTSLDKQSQLLKKTLDDGQEALKQPKIQKDLAAQLAHFLQALNDVAQPVVQRAYRMSSQANKDNASQLLEDYESQKEIDFGQILNVDANSLSQQKTALQEALKKGQALVGQATTNADFDSRYEQAIALLDQVATPNIEESAQTAGQNDQEAAKGQLEKTYEAMLSNFNQVDNVDQSSYDQQKSVLDALLHDWQQALSKEQSKQSLADQLRQAKTDLNSVSLPKVEAAYRPVQENDLTQAKQALDQAVLDQETQMKQVDHVDSQSLEKQLGALEALKTKGENALSSQKTQGDLADQLTVFLNDVLSVNEPVVEHAYQEADQQYQQNYEGLLAQIGQKQIEAFGKIDNVEKTSLQEQTDQINALVKKGQSAIRAAKTKGAVDSLFSDYQKQISHVAKPNLDVSHQEISQADRDSQEAALDAYGQAIKDAMAKIEHVDPDSLTAQEAAIDQVLNEAKTAIGQTKNTGDLMTVTASFASQLNEVAQPSLLYAYQTADDSQLKQAQNSLAQTYQSKKQLLQSFKQTANENSYQDQLKLLDDRYSAAQKGLVAGLTHQALDQLLSQDQAKLLSVANPDQIYAKQNASADDREAALTALQNAVDQKKAAMESIPLVDAQSLKQQEGALTDLLDQQAGALNEEQSKESLSNRVTSALLAVFSLANPSQQVDPQAVSSSDIAGIKAQLTSFEQGIESDNAGIFGVDPLSLRQQDTTLENLLQEKLQELDQAKTKDELENLYYQGMKSLNAVDKPTLIKDYQKPSSDFSRFAKQALADLASQKMGALDHVDGAAAGSLNNQLDLVKKAWQKANSALSQAKTMADLALILRSGQEAINQVADPVLRNDVNPISDQERKDAESDLFGVGQDRKDDFKNIQNVDPKSLAAQSEKIDSLVQTALNELANVKNKADLAYLRIQLVKQVMAVPEPNVLASPSDKKAADEKLKEEKAKKEAQIDQDTGASEAKKAAAKEKVDEDFDRFDQAIWQADTNDELNQALQQGIDQIDAVSVDASTPEQPNQPGHFDRSGAGLGNGQMANDRVPGTQANRLAEKVNHPLDQENRTDRLKANAKKGQKNEKKKQGKAIQKRGTKAAKKTGQMAWWQKTLLSTFALLAVIFFLLWKRRRDDKND